MGKKSGGNSGSSKNSASEAAKAAINLKVLRKSDGSITDIAHSASFCVLYEFGTNAETGARSWIRKDIEGSMFIVRRSEAPLYRVRSVEAWKSVF